MITVRAFSPAFADSAPCAGRPGLRGPSGLARRPLRHTSRRCVDPPRGRRWRAPCRAPSNGTPGRTRRHGLGEHLGAHVERQARGVLPSRCIRDDEPRILACTLVNAEGPRESLARTPVDVTQVEARGRRSLDEVRQVRVRVVVRRLAGHALQDRVEPPGDAQRQARQALRHHGSRSAPGTEANEPSAARVALFLLQEVEVRRVGGQVEREYGSARHRLVEDAHDAIHLRRVEVSEDRVAHDHVHALGEHTPQMNQVTRKHGGRDSRCEGPDRAFGEVRRDDLVSSARKSSHERCAPPRPDVQHPGLAGALRRDRIEERLAPRRAGNPRSRM